MTQKDYVIKAMEQNGGYATFQQLNHMAEFTHAYYQGIIVEIGNIRQYATYVPPQDKNKKFLGQSLSQLISTDVIYDFTYPEAVMEATNWIEF